MTICQKVYNISDVPSTTLREGTTLDGMSDGASKLGDGSPWTPAITVKGDASGFYSIKVTK